MGRSALLFTLLLSVAARAGEASGSVTLASEYIYRGLALSDGNPALQGGLDYSFDNGLFAGAWASTVDLAGATGRRDLEFDVYAGYQLSPLDSLDLAATLLWRSYPGQSGEMDYDYAEATLAATLRGRYTLEFGYTNDYYGTGYASHHWEARVDWPVRSAWVLSGGAGYNDVSELATSNYWYWDFGASARVAWLTFDLRWYDNESLDGYYAPLAAGSQLVLSLSTGF